MTSRGSLLGLLLLSSLAASAAKRPVAQWDVVPFQRVSAPFNAGVVAFYDQGFKVEFTVNGKPAATVGKAAMNDRTKVEEHFFTLDPAKFDAAKLKDAQLVLGAKVVADDGTSHSLPELVLYLDKDGKLGSHKEIWLDSKDGIDYSDGSKDHPVKTMRQAVRMAGDGGTVYLAKPGVYSAERIGGANNHKYWVTVCPAAGVNRKDVRVKGGRTGCDRLHFKDVQIFSDIVKGQSYAMGGVDEKSICWLENCIVRDAGGRGAGRSYTFGNKTTGYVTGGATTEMGQGPCCKLVRNHVIKSVSGDPFTGCDCLAINCRLSDVDASGVMDEPAFHRAQGIQGAWTHDVILANIEATECACNGFIGLKLRDSVFSNIKLETTGSERRFVSRYAWEMENVIFDKVSVTGQEWVWFKATNNNGNFTPVDVRITGCSFELPEPEKE